MMLTAVALGSIYLSPREVLLALGGGGSLASAEEAIFWSARLPRVLLAAVVGGGLAVVGATFQSVFRNPLADSGLLGVGSGAALGAVAAVKLGWGENVFLAVPLAAFAGAMAAVLLVYGLGHIQGAPDIHRLLLTGIAVSALTGAGTSLLLVSTEEYRVKTVLFWLAGGLDGRSWTHLEVGALFILPGCALLLVLGRPLDLLSLGEEEAASLGLPVHLARVGVLSLASLVAGVATALAGSVAFVGLMAPHALRPLVGPLGKHLLVAAFLAGAALLMGADLAARTFSDRLELPLGALTAVLGAPYFLFALRGRA
jgi:iron complex transport system permease protein